MRGEEAREVLLKEAEDEHMAHWRQRCDQNDRKGDEGQQIPGSPPERLHLQEEETPQGNEIYPSLGLHPDLVLRRPQNPPAQCWHTCSRVVSPTWGVMLPNMQAALP